MLASMQLDPDLWSSPTSGTPVFRSAGLAQLGGAHRRFLYEHLSGTIKQRLAPFIDKVDSQVTNTDIANYDRTLLDYMSNRFAIHSESHWLFDHTQVATIIGQLKKDQTFVEEVEGTVAKPGMINDARAMQSASVTYAGTSRSVHQFALGEHPNKTDPATGLRVDRVGIKRVSGGYIDWLHPKLYGNYSGISAEDSRGMLNRFPFLYGEALAYRWSGEAKIGDELVSQLKSWAYQNQPLRAYAGTQGAKDWADYAAAKQTLWEPLATAIRVNPLMNAYNLMLGTRAWTGEVNTLFVLLMYRHGNTLAQWEMSRGGVKEQPMNKGFKALTTLMTLSRLFPEFTDTDDMTVGGKTVPGWRTLVRTYLPASDLNNHTQKVTRFGGSGAYPPPDGLQKEESPNYAYVVTSNLIDQFLLSKRNRSANTNAFFSQILDTLTKPASNPSAIPLETRVNALLKIANPDGTMPEAGDSYRSSMLPLFLNASTVATGSWPRKRPSVSEYFSLYNLGLKPGELTDPSPPLDRTTVSVPIVPNAFSLPHNGYFMLQQDPSLLDDPRDAVQLTFKSGPMGLRSPTADGHSQYDLLSFALTGRQRPLIQDPGLYTYRTIGDGSTNNWTKTTNANNSFTVDDYSHARMDGYFGYTQPRLKFDSGGSANNGLYVEGWHNGYVNIDPDAQGPRLARTIWHDKDSTFLIIDWAKQKSAKPHTLKISFTIPLAVHAPFVSNKWGVKRVIGLNGSDANGIYTDTSNLPGADRDTGNLLIEPVPNHDLATVACIRAAQDALGTTTGPFVTAPDNSSEAEPAARFYMTQKTDADHPVATFVTLVHPYDRAALADPMQAVDTSVKARIFSQSDDAVVIDFFKGQTRRRLYFYSPFMANGSAMLNNAGAAPTEKIADPNNPTQFMTVVGLPRTTATGFPSGMESTRPPPLDSNRGGQLIPSSGLVPATDSTWVGAGIAGVARFGEAPISDAALEIVEQLV